MKYEATVYGDAAVIMGHLSDKCDHLEAENKRLRERIKHLEDSLKRCTDILATYLPASGCNGIMVVDQHLQNILDENKRLRKTEEVIIGILKDYENERLVCWSIPELIKLALNQGDVK